MLISLGYCVLCVYETVPNRTTRPYRLSRSMLLALVLPSRDQLCLLRLYANHSKLHTRVWSPKLGIIVCFSDETPLFVPLWSYVSTCIGVSVCVPLCAIYVGLMSVSEYVSKCVCLKLFKCMYVHPISRLSPKYIHLCVTRSPIRFVFSWIGTWSTCLN